MVTLDGHLGADDVIVRAEVNTICSMRRQRFAHAKRNFIQIGFRMFAV
ncbi:hypothetical protein [Achromobacter deleyi]|nr:hypothetical protein [Achromobacter deleyi]QVQ26329.1 hypothetical protein HLG70_26385 [Achromobacter deleyi]UIP21893.1 hypothetical protein LYZ39_05060 [Achromobacter deleyi]